MGDLATLPSQRTPTTADSTRDLILPDLSLRSDFRMFTASLDLTDQQTAAGAPVLHAVGSSTVQDLQGDTMGLSALQDMTESPVGLAIFLNHSYTVPEDVAGHLATAPTIVVQNGIGDLHLDIALNTANPRAMDAYKAIQNGTRLGISIGCMIREAIWQTADGQPVDQDEVSFWDVIEGKVVLQILHVQTLEFSIVGIPANQRSWVQYAAQGLFTRGLTDGAPDLRLAPLVRAWFPREYERLALNVADEAQRKQLLDIAPRRSAGSPNVLWRPSEKTFALATPGGRTQAVTREKLASLLHAENGAPVRLATLTAAAETPAASHGASETPEASPGTSLEASAVAPDTEKSATGKTDWPLADRERAWDNGEAHQRIVDWAGGKDDLDVAKMKSVHFWSPDGDDAQNVSEYKLLYCDVIGGDVKAVPHAIFACAGAHGVDAADIPEADRAKIKPKIERYYTRMADEFGDDSIKVPWADEKASEPDAEKTIAGSGGELVVKADGTHAAYSGTHTHSHSAFGDQGNDNNHEHAHSHDGDANHHHSHDKAADGIEKTGIAAQADGVERTVTLAADPARAAMLKMFSDMVAPHGFVVMEASQVATSQATPDAQKCSWTDTQQAAIIAGLTAIDREVDGLMQIADIPDEDDDADEDAEKRVTRLITRTLGLGRALKEGKRHSQADLESLQAIHDAVMELTDGACCATMSVAAPEDNADGGNHPQPDGAGSGSDMDDAREMASTGKALSGVATHLEALTKTLGGLDVKALESQVQEAQTRLTAALTATKAAEDRLAFVQRQQEAIASSTEQMQQRIERLANVPLGRPTGFHTRTVQPGQAPHQSGQSALALQAVNTPLADRDTATYADLLAVNGVTPVMPQTPNDLVALAFAQTTKEYVAGLGMCRHWPAGVGKGVRPSLSSEQRIALGQLPDAVGNLLRYQDGDEALIPIVNEGE